MMTILGNFFKIFFFQNFSQKNSDVLFEALLGFISNNWKKYFEKIFVKDLREWWMLKVFRLIFLTLCPLEIKT